jgi:hypothetical protein
MDEFPFFAIHFHGQVYFIVPNITNNHRNESQNHNNKSIYTSLGWGYSQKIRENSVVSGDEFCTLLMGMCKYTNSTKNNIEILQKFKNEIAMQYRKSTAMYILKGNKMSWIQRYLHDHVQVELFIITKLWKLLSILP